MKRQYRFFFTHKQSQVFVKLYSILKKFRLKSNSIDAFMKHGGLKEIITRREIDGYSFRGAEYIFGQLYHISKAPGLKAKLNRLASKNGGGGYDFRLETLTKAFSSNSAAYDVNIGSVQLSKGELSDLFSAVSFSVQIVNNSYFMLFSSFHINDGFNTLLNTTRFQEITIGRVGISFVPKGKRFMFSIPTQQTYDSLYRNKLSLAELRVSKYLGSFFDQPLVSVNNLITLYNTEQNARSKIHDDFRRGSIGYLPLYFKDDMLYQEEGSFSGRTFLKRDNIDVEKGYLEYPNYVVKDFGAFMLFNALKEYVSNIEIATTDLVKKLAKLSALNRSSTLKKLKRYNASLITSRYEIDSVKNLINSPDWNLYIRSEMRDNVAIKRMSYFDGKKVDNIENFTKRLESDMAATKEVIRNASSRVEAELNARNTESNNRLSLIVLVVSVIGLAVALVTIFVTVYPRTTRQVVCSSGFFCEAGNKEDEDTKPTVINIIEAKPNNP